MSLCRVFAAALFLLGASTASAQDAAVERAIDEGLALRQQSRDAEALAVFERAYAQHREPRLLAQVGFAEQALGRWRLAEEHLREVQRAADDPWVVEHAALLERSLGTIATHLGTVELVGGEPGARVTLNGEERGTLPEAASLRVAAGSVVLEIHADGFFPFQRQIQLRAGATSRETVQLIPRSSEEPEPDATPEPAATSTDTGTSEPGATSGGGFDGEPLVIVGVASLIAGGISAILSGVFYGLREDEAAYLASSACDPEPGQRVRDDAACLEAYDFAVGYEAASVATLVAGATLVVVGAVLLGVGASAPGPSTSSGLSCLDRRTPLGCSF